MVAAITAEGEIEEEVACVEGAAEDEAEEVEGSMTITLRTKDNVKSIACRYAAQIYATRHVSLSR